MRSLVALRPLLAIAVGAAAALLALGPLGRTEATVGPGRVEISAVPTWQGQTVVELPPLGRVEASTHGSPLTLTARVLAVDIEAAQDAAVGADPVANLRAEVDAALPDLLRTFVLRALVVAAIAGAVAAMVLPRRRWWHPAVGAASGLLAVSSLLAATWSTYDSDGFAEPNLSGELERVPGLLRAVERNLEGFDQVRGRVDAISARLAELYAASVDELPGGAPGETAILHVTDLHLNPLGAELAVQLASDLDVDAVLDTGDVTSFGLSIESRFGRLLQASRVPYFIVPGNHDSLQNRAELAALDGITVLDEDVVTIGGVRILGIGDPTFTASNEVSTEEANERKLALANDVRLTVIRTRPDLLAVHDFRQASESTGFVPVVVAGHRHRTSTERSEGTWILELGSTGATGLGSFAVETARPYEAQVLRFLDGELVAVDHVAMTGLGGEFRLERRLVPTDDDEADTTTTSSSSRATSTSTP